MTTRSIGIDYGSGVLRIVVLQTDKGQQRLLRHGSLPWDGTQNLADLFRERLGIIPAFGDRAATALPPATGYTRLLAFPFADRRKIEATVPLELATQLPVALDDCIIDQQEPVAAADGVNVAAAAVPAAAVAAAVSPCDRAGIPLQIVDLFPCALAAGLAADFGDDLLLCLADGWGTLLVLEQGQLHDYRVLPLPRHLTPEERGARLLRELRPFDRLATDQPLRIFGADADAALVSILHAELPAVRHLVTSDVAGEPLPGELLPALALARRAARHKGASFNFRRGAFSRSGEDAALRTRLLLLGALLGVALLVLGASLGLRWWAKNREATALKQELTLIYRAAVPGEGTVVDETLQLRARLAELTRSSRPGGRHPDLTPLAVLRDLSERTPSGDEITFRELSYSGEEVRIDAVARSFDAANRLAALLAESPLYRSAQVADAKTGADNRRVDFRLILTLRTAEELP